MNIEILKTDQSFPFFQVLPQISTTVWQFSFSQASVHICWALFDFDPNSSTKNHDLSTTSSSYNSYLDYAWIFQNSIKFGIHSNQKRCWQLARITNDSSTVRCNVPWSDETITELLSQSSQQHVCKKPDTGDQLINSIPTVKFEDGSNIVWGCVSAVRTGSGANITAKTEEKK